MFVFRWSLARGESIASQGEKFSSFSFFNVGAGVLNSNLGCQACTAGVLTMALSPQLSPSFRAVSENSVNLIHTLLS